MPKKREDEIQQKLVELELSIKDEETKKNVPAASTGQSTGLTTTTDSSEKSGTDEFDFQQIGGIFLLGLGLCILLGHLQFIPNWGFWGRGPMLGLMVIPLMVGIGMLFYNYKSRLAQAITVGSVVLLILLALSSLSLAFTSMTVLDFLLMGVPICLGGALLAKSYQQRKKDKG